MERETRTSGRSLCPSRDGPSLVITLAVIFLAFLSAAAMLGGCGEKESPLLTGGEEETPVVPVSGLSSDQSRKVAEIGYPDQFFISIDPESGDRVERWTYISAGVLLRFDNGRLSGEEPLEDEAAEYQPTDLRPQDFDELMTPEEAAQLLGEPLYTREVRDSIMPENTIVVYGKAVLLYREGKLIGVETQVSPPDLPTL